MQRSLRILQPRPMPVAHGNSASAGLFWAGLIAIVLQLLLSANVLAAMGLDTVGPGGNFFLKVHPSSYIVVIGGIIALKRGEISLHRRFKRSFGLMMFILGIPSLFAYSIYWTGFSGSAVYIESYWSAGMLALMLESGTPAQKRLLGRVLLYFCVVNVCFALYESMTQTSLFPMQIADLDVGDMPVNTDEFRAQAFFNHPLTASLITSMAIFLLYNMKMRFVAAGSIFGFLLLGLLAYGGRTALGVTLIMSALAALWMLFDGILRRNLKMDFVAAIVSAAIIVPVLAVIVVTQTTIGDRIVNNLYFDGSAEVRVTQWLVLDHLTLSNWLFGISHTDLDRIKYQIGLGGAQTDIENFWLLMFLNLGLIGFAVFVAVFVGFLLHLARYAGTMNGWLIVVAAVIIDSTSNSLGVKSVDLFIEVGFVIAVAGFRDFRPARAPVTRVHRHAETGLRLGVIQGVLGNQAMRQARAPLSLSSR